MNRRHPRKLLSLYLDEAATPLQKQTVEDHLQQCARCAREMQILQHLRQRMQELPKPALPPGLASRIMVRFRQQQRRASFWSSFDFAPRILQPATVLLLLLAALLFVWENRTQSLYDQAVRSYTAALENNSGLTSLDNDEDALRFALNQPLELHPERDHDQQK